jgi:hypothetical protein
LTPAYPDAREGDLQVAQVLAAFVLGSRLGPSVVVGIVMVVFAMFWLTRRP